uniref:Uncharacterized protein n=1 Tax=Mycobacterium riyadhense TaxID=486698 RepID=A0A653F735_9MYCO|nr:hypothetical protein BIN_B_05708 [Mycobacterium riyadhense]
MEVGTEFRHCIYAPPDGFTAAEFAAKIHALTSRNQNGYSVRQASYDVADAVAVRCARTSAGPAG